MNQQIIKQIKKQRRAKRTRAVIKGTASRPRLTVFRSNANIYAQLIDDQAGRTIAAVHSQSLAKGKPMAIAETVGRELAKQALAKQIKLAIFDRGANKYHGRIKAVADGARAGGLEF